MKSGTPKFVPDLPQNIERAIEGASCSGLEKVYLAFPSAFWEESSATDTTKGSTVQEPEVSILTHFLRPDYVPAHQQEWRLEVVALSSPSTFGDYVQPVLLFDLWDVSAIAVKSAIADLDPSSHLYHSTITNLFRPFYSRLPHYKADDPNCRPVAAIATNWRNDEFARGSYTNFQVPVDGVGVKVDEGVRLIRQGLPERGIWFAGEHTAPLVALGTSTGAYWSGEIAAMKIVEARNSGD